jgi:UDP-N-acetylglucosamine transferase subunit ALG13
MSYEFEFLLKGDSQRRTDDNDISQQCHETNDDIVLMRLRSLYDGPVDDHLCDLTAYLHEIVQSVNAAGFMQCVKRLQDKDRSKLKERLCPFGNVVIRSYRQRMRDDIR